LTRNSPMMEQYKAVKARHPDKLLMFQVGDFYELFFDDAEVAAREMGIALTSRDAGSENPIPLAGVPIHAAETYLNRLLKKGFKVVVCDQVESASQAKGLVRREITRILTPGTVTDPEMLDEGLNNFLAVLVEEGSSAYGLAAVDISTGDFLATEQRGEEAWAIIIDQLRRFQPSEILCGSEDLHQKCSKTLKINHIGLIDRLPNVPDLKQSNDLITEQWDRETWQSLNLEQYPLAACATGAALTYLRLLQQLPAEKKHFHELRLYFNRQVMVIDNITSRNLELTQSLREGVKQGSLLAFIDRCMTGMGRRMLRRWLEEPLIDRPAIEDRLDAVGELVDKPLERRDLRKLLDEIFDLERFCSRLSYQRINARDLVTLKNSLFLFKPLKELLSSLNTAYLVTINNCLPLFNDLAELLDIAVVEDPPLALKEGGLFKTGYSKELDELKKISTEGRDLLIDYEKNERSRTGIKSLRVGYNRNFGYYLEVTRSNLDLVPPEYNRKQTLVNAERFTTDELQQMEEQISGAKDKMMILEYQLFESLREQVSTYGEALQAASYQLASLDCLQSLAECAEKNHYCRPYFADNKKMLIRQGRHPVVEQLSFERFVPNDISMNHDHYLLIITGPNMAGKSTYIRSAALIALMAQMGSFVPAEKAELPILDRIFARVGASDDLSRGHSTFMVEMQETATILREATADSLVILDEIGRGTSTYDGLSIARSVIEYMSRRIKAKTLFSTHYHELTKLEGELPGAKNYTMAIKEKGKEVIFLRQVIPGRSDKSYGINVARLAGVPPEVLVRAEIILSELELSASSAAEQQLSLVPMFTVPEQDHQAELAVAEKLKEVDLNRLTPLEALQKLYELQLELLEREKTGDIHVDS
jgi:DNA mismatch repair protein MutS